MKAAKRLLELAQKEFPTRNGTAHKFALASDGRLEFTLYLPCELKVPPCWQSYLIDNDELDMDPDVVWQEIKRLGWELK